MAGDIVNGDARTGVAVLKQRVEDCQKHSGERFETLEGQVRAMEKRSADTERALERALLSLKIYGGILLFVAAAVQPILVALVLRYIGVK